MSTIVLRSVKGSPLTNAEVDANFSNLNTDKVEKTSAAITGGTVNNTSVGATTPSTGAFTSLTDSGNLTFTGTGNRITGDFSNATVANRVAFQSSTTNGDTAVGLIPNGTSTATRLGLHNGSDVANCSLLNLVCTSSATVINSAIYGTGTYLPMTFFTGGSERLRIDTSGNVGVGVVPSAWASGNRFIDVNASASFGAFGSTDSMMLANAYWSGSNWVRKNANNAWRMAMESSSGAPSWTFQYAGNSTAGSTISWSEAMRIDSSGNVGIGTSSPTTKLDVNGSIVSRAAGGEGGEISFNNPDNASVGLVVDVSSADNARIFQTRNNCAMSIGQLGGTGGTVLFYTAAAERARIDSSGNLLVGTTSAYGNARLSVNGGSIIANAPTSGANGTYSFADNGSSPNTLRLYNTTDSNNTTNRFLICDTAASVLRAEIRSNGGLANYQGNNTNLSDRREKTNFAPAKSYLDTICAIPVQTFNYVDQNMENDPGLTLGVVAQDVQSVAPELVVESNWGSKDDPKMRLSIYQTDLQYALMKALQELKAEFDAYKSTHP
jgi:hypothetical protein